MDLSANDVREVRFGTTRIRAGYDISEVDEFLDRVEKSIAEYADNYRRVQDEAEALRSQVQQIQGRLEATQAELAELAELGQLNEARSQTVDLDSTAENPVVVLEPTGPEGTETLDDLRRIRDDVRQMLQRQLELVDSVQVPAAPDAPDSPNSPD